MKVGVVKIGFNNIVFDLSKRVSNGTLGEIEQIIKLFVNTGCQVTICDNNNDEDKIAKNLAYNNIHFGVNNLRHCSVVKDQKLEADILCVIGGTSNFFGGHDTNHVLNTYKFINEFEGKILFFHTDPLCVPMAKIGRPVGLKTKYDIPTEVYLKNSMYLVNCEKSFNPEKKPWNKKNVVNQFDEVFNFEFSKSCIFNDRLKDIPEKETDLVYGGFFRGGVRKKQMLEYFFDTPYSSRFFGKISLADFKLETDKCPEFKMQTGGWDFFKQETAKALATVIFAEETYQDNIVTMRVYYSVLSNTVVFVDNKYDSKHNLFKDDFYYVNNKQELEERINKLKTLTPKEYKEMLDYQYKCLNYSKEDYYNEFKEILDKVISK